MTSISRLIAAFMLAGATNALLTGCFFGEEMTITVAPNASGDYYTYQATLNVSECGKTPMPPGVEISCSVGSATSTLDAVLTVATLAVLFDPLIVEVPASSTIGGEVVRCYPFLGSELCSSIGALKVTQGLASIPVDVNTQLRAEPGMQLAILDFPSFPPNTAPPGKYQFKVVWNHPAPTVKAIFTVKVEAGGTTYYAPILPCTSDFADVAAVPASATISGLQLLSLVAGMTPCNHKAYDFGGGAPPGGGTANYQGLWWVPNGAENYWGINFVHQGDQVFATWYTYDTSGNPWWLSMLANRTSPAGNAYSGDINVDSGPPFSAYVGKGVPTKVGTGTLTFGDANNGTFSYSVDTGAGPVAQMKTLTRYVLDLGTAQPACTYSASTPNFASAANYQDLWWVAGAAEDGWGINFAHQGKLLFGTWYTYGTNGAPLWLSVLATQGASSSYTGTLYRTSGPHYDAYDTTKAVSQQVGTATFTFSDGNHATFDYATNGNGSLPSVIQSKQITRFPFAAAGGTLCQ